MRILMKTFKNCEENMKSIFFFRTLRNKSKKCQMTNSIGTRMLWLLKYWRNQRHCTSFLGSSRTKLRHNNIILIDPKKKWLFYALSPNQTSWITTNGTFYQQGRTERHSPFILFQQLRAVRAIQMILTKIQAEASKLIAI